MKHVTATEARKNWFTLLDEALKGEVIAIRRNGKNLVLKRHTDGDVIPDYSKVLKFDDAENADSWGWEWRGPGKLTPKSKRKTPR